MTTHNIIETPSVTTINYSLVDQYIAPILHKNSETSGPHEMLATPAELLISGPSRKLAVVCYVEANGYD
jgi:hypothetical protein